MTDLHQVPETTDLPAGVVNIVTGGRDQVVPTIAACRAGTIATCPILA